MKDSRLSQHELGFLQVIDRPSPEAFADYYETNCFQNESANYRKSFSALETEAIDLRIAHQARLTLERQIGLSGLDAANRFYAALGGVGLGRNITAFLRPALEINQL